MVVIDLIFITNAIADKVPNFKETKPLGEKCHKGCWEEMSRSCLPCNLGKSTI